MWLDCWGSDEVRWKSEPARVSVRPGTTKWQRAAELLSERPELMEYEAVWFPDDDVTVSSPGDVDRLFETFTRLGLWLAQPGLGWGSFYSHVITLANTSFDVRFTNYVEVMAPVFARGALEACAPTFTATASGWGLDLVWPKLLGTPRDRIGVIDSIPMIHTRPVGKGDWYRSLGSDPRAEMEVLVRAHSIEWPYEFRQFGALRRARGDGRRGRFVEGLPFVVALATGTPSPLRTSRYYWAYQLRTVLAGHRSPVLRRLATRVRRT